MEVVIKNCLKCGAIVEVIKDCNCENCGIVCCNEKMLTLKPNSVDAAFEKHVPTYEIKNGKVFARVNHVMEEGHYIEFLLYASQNRIEKVVFKPNQKPEAVFDFNGGGTLYAYCNKHLLWKNEVK